jgi:hypothetical protein
MSRPGVEASQQDSHEGGIDVAPELTHVDLLWIKQRVDNRIRLGRIDQQHVIDCHPHVVSFSAGSVFAFVRWASNAYRTVLSRIDTLRAVAPGERYVTVPDVHPGGESLLQIPGWPSRQGAPGDRGLSKHWISIPPTWRPTGAGIFTIVRPSATGRARIGDSPSVQTRPAAYFAAYHLPMCEPPSTWSTSPVTCGASDR